MAEVLVMMTMMMERGRKRRRTRDACLDLDDQRFEEHTESALDEGL